MSRVLVAWQWTGAHRVPVLKIALTIGLLVLFLLGSRLPAEAAKIAAIQSPAWEPEGRYPISFSDRWEVPTNAPLLEAIVLTALNFWRANMMGMTFGLILGGATLSLLRSSGFLERLASRRGLQGTLIGTLVGAPLNLCANCASILSDGIGRRTGTPEVAYAVIFGSALWNVVDLSAIAALFPRPILLARLAFAAVSVLTLPPLAQLLARTCEPGALEARGTAAIGRAALEGDTSQRIAETWSTALVVTLHSWARSSATLTLESIPAMLVATLLAAVARVAVQPLLGAAGDSLSSIVTYALAGTVVSIPVLFELPLGIFATQLGAGVGGVAALMCAAPSVGIFTVVLAARIAGWRLAVAVFFFTFVLAVGAGLLAHILAVHGGL